MATSLLERRYPPLGNGFVDVDVPSCEKYLFQIKAVLGVGSCRRSSSLSGYLLQPMEKESCQNAMGKKGNAGDSNKIPTAPNRTADLEAAPFLQHACTTSSFTEFTTESSGFTPVSFPIQPDSEDMQHSLSGTPCMSAAANLEEPGDQLGLPKSLQLMLNAQSGKDEVLDRMLASHGWTGKYFTCPPDWAAYMKILTRATKALNSNSRLYNLLAEGQEMQDVKNLVDRSMSQANLGLALWDRSEIEESAPSTEFARKQPLLVADLLPGPIGATQKGQPQQQSHAAQDEDTAIRGRSKSHGESKPLTTLMIQHMPPEMQQREILAELDRSGFKDQYDFCHVPCDFSKKIGLGFAFVNFVSESAAAMFMTEWHGSYRLNKSIALNIRPAAVQGYENNVNKWSSQRLRRIRNPNFRPYIVEKSSQPSDEVSAVDGFQDISSDASSAYISPPADLRDAAPPESAVPLPASWRRMR